MDLWSHEMGLQDAWSMPSTYLDSIDISHARPDLSRQSSPANVASAGIIQEGLLVRDFFENMMKSRQENLIVDERTDCGVLKLVFTHNCCKMSCNSDACTLCKNNLLRHCQDGAYFNDQIVRCQEPVKAKCNAPICVNLQDTATNGIHRQSIDLRVVVVDGKKFDEELGGLHSHGLMTSDHFHAWLNGNHEQDGPLMKCKQKDILVTRQGISVKMKNGAVSLPDIYLTGGAGNKRTYERSSYFRIICTPFPGFDSQVLPAVSPMLKTISTRFRRDPTRPKATPHETDPVTRLRKVGQERARIMATMGIETVGDLRREIEKSMENRIKIGKQVMGCENADWDNICEAVMSATMIDDRPRVWRFRYGNGNWCNAVFECKQAVIDRSGPTELYSRDRGSIPASTLGAAELHELRHAAFSDWDTHGHPNWDVLQPTMREPVKRPTLSPFVHSRPPPDISFPVPASQESDLLPAMEEEFSLESLSLSIDEMLIADPSLQSCRSSMNSLEWVRALTELDMPTM